MQARHQPVPSADSGQALAVALDSHDSGLLQARYITPQRAHYHRAQNAFHGAMAIAHRHQNPALEMRALVAAACVDFTDCRFEQSVERNLRAVGVGGQVDQPLEDTACCRII